MKPGHEMASEADDHRGNYDQDVANNSKKSEYADFDEG